MAGDTDEQLRTSGAVLLEGVGWFCGARCERQYRLRFRIQSAGGNPRTSPTPVPRSSTPSESTVAAELAEPTAPKRRSAQDELAAALLARRQKYSSGV